MTVTLLAAAHHADLALLFVLVALIAFAVAVWLCSRGQWIAGLAAAVVGVVVLLYG